MTAPSPAASAVPAGSAEAWPWRLFRRIVMAEAALAGASIVAMMLVSCADVVLRAVSSTAFAGAYDLVRIGGVLAAAFSLPYTTAVKGHVAIEFFFQKLPRPARIVTDAAVRLLVMALFLVLAWYAVRYGVSMWRHREVSPTLQVPLFWVPWAIAAACVTVAGVKIYHIAHPGREMIKP